MMDSRGMGELFGGVVVIDSTIGEDYADLFPADYSSVLTVFKVFIVCARGAS
jgi:hypothetical protein